MTLLTENDVIDQVCQHLSRCGWEVYARATTVQRGPDIAATRAEDHHLVVEAKGQTSARRNSPRYGQPFTSAQVRVHVAEAFYTAAAAAEPRAQRFGAVALPDDELHRRYLAVVRDAMTTLTIATRKLREGKSFDVAFAGLRAPARGDGEIWAPDQLFTALGMLAGLTFTHPSAVADDAARSDALDDEHPDDQMLEDDPVPEENGGEAGGARSPAEVLADVKDELAALGLHDLHHPLSPRPNAGKLIALLRGAGGLDAWFAEVDQLGGADTFEEEFLEYAELEAAGMLPLDYARSPRSRQTQLNEARDKQNGIQLLTIHGAKGLQWPDVVVLDCNDGMLPNSRALRASAQAIARGEGIEAERRIAYVAFTRAQQHLHLFYTPDNQSDFLREAELVRPDGRVR